MEVQTPRGEKYFLTFIDGNSHYLKVKLLWLKSNTFSAIKALIEQAEVETGKRINFFQSDGGGEYGSNEFAASRKWRGRTYESDHRGDGPVLSQGRGTSQDLLGVCGPHSRPILGTSRPSRTFAFLVAKLGYSEHKRAYILLHRPSGRIFESRDVHFDEGDGAEAERVVIEADFTLMKLRSRAF